MKTLSDSKLRVWPNPPNALPEDPEHHPGIRAFVGATLAHDVVGRGKDHKLVNGRIVEQVIEKTRARFAFAAEPVELPDTLYYRQAVRTGDLVAADKATADLAGVRTYSAEMPEALAAFAPKPPAHDATGDRSPVEQTPPKPDPETPRGRKVLRSGGE